MAKMQPLESILEYKIRMRAYELHYIRTVADDVRDAMTKLENSIPEAGRSDLDTSWTPNSNSITPN